MKRFVAMSICRFWFHMPSDVSFFMWPFSVLTRTWLDSKETSQLMFVWEYFYTFFHSEWQSCGVEYSWTEVLFIQYFIYIHHSILFIFYSFISMFPLTDFYWYFTITLIFFSLYMKFCFCHAAIRSLSLSLTLAI